MIVAADFSQIELRDAALESGDVVLCEVFRKGGDPHTAATIAAEGEEVLKNPYFKSGDRTRDPRQWYKQSNFLMLYRGGPERYRDTMLDLTGRWLPLEECERVVYTNRAALRGVWEWQESLIATVKAVGYLQLPISLRRRYFNAGKDVPEICNFLVQADSADIMCLDVMPYLHRHLPRLHLPCPPLRLFQNIHDSIKIDCKSRDHALEAAHLINNAVQESVRHGFWARMQDHYKRELPLRIDLTLDDSPLTLST